MKFTNFKTIKLATAPTTGDNPPSGAIYEWHSLDGSNNLVINYRLPDGTNKTFSSGAEYELPTASASVLGGVKIGSGLSIADGVVAATGGSLPVTALGTSGTQTIDRSVSDKFSIAPTGGVTLATSNFTDMQEAFIKLINPNNHINYPSSWHWKNGSPPAQPSNGYNLIKLFAAAYDSSSIINADDYHTWYNAPENCVLWLPCDGTGGSSTFIDAAGRHSGIYSNGTCTISNDVKHSGSGAANCSSGGLLIPSSADFNFAGQFTIQMYINLNALAGYNVVTVGNYGNWQIQTNGGSGEIGIQRGGWHSAGNQITATGTWYKIAITRNTAGLMSLWVNDISVLSFTDTTNLSADVMYIGAANNVGNLNGYIDDIQVYKGVCLYN